MLFAQFVAYIAGNKMKVRAVRSKVLMHYTLEAKVGYYLRLRRRLSKELEGNAFNAVALRKYNRVTNQILKMNQRYPKVSKLLNKLWK